MIHQQGIRRSIGLPRTIDPERLLAALDFARFAPTLRGAWRARGVRLVATDIDWAYALDDLDAQAKPNWLSASEC